MKLGQFAGIQALEWFLSHPTKQIHFKELCRELKLSPPTISEYCGQFVNRQWLKEERKANLRFFSLNNESYAVKSIKRAYFLESLSESGIEEIIGEGIVSFALYGSHASGEYDERSDVDLLVIGRKEQVNYENAKRIEKKLGKKMQITVIEMVKWEKNRLKDQFILSVLKNHVIIRGVSL